jgi:hypothetical protein
MPPILQWHHHVAAKLPREPLRAQEPQPTTKRSRHLACRSALEDQPLEILDSPGPSCIALRNLTLHLRPAPTGACADVRESDRPLLQRDTTKLERREQVDPGGHRHCA